MATPERLRDTRTKTAAVVFQQHSLQPQHKQHKGRIISCRHRRDKEPMRQQGKCLDVEATEEKSVRRGEIRHT